MWSQIHLAAISSGWFSQSASESDIFEPIVEIEGQAFDVGLATGAAGVALDGLLDHLANGVTTNATAGAQGDLPAEGRHLVIVRPMLLRRHRRGGGGRGALRLGLQQIAV